MSDSTASVQVLFFAAARDAVGAREASIAVASEGETVAGFADRVVERFPSLGPHMRSLRWAVNGEYVSRDHVVRPGDEVAVLPPVAGG